MARGVRQRIVIGTGHPGATCQGAALGFITNVHKDLVKQGARHNAGLLWLPEGLPPGPIWGTEEDSL